MAVMYANEKDLPQKPYVGESVALVNFNFPVPSTRGTDTIWEFTSVDRSPYAAIGVYVPNNSVLVGKGEFFQVSVKPDKAIESSSAAGYHKDGLSIFRLKEGRLEQELSPESLKGKDLKFAGLAPR